MASGHLAHLLWIIAQIAPPPAARSQITWSSELQLSSLAAIDGLLVQPLDDMPAAVLADKSARPIKTCRDLLAVRKLDFNELSPDDTKLAWESLQSEAVRCFALNILKTAKPAFSSYLNWFKFSRAGILELPAGLTASLYEDETKKLAKATTKCERWGKYDPELKVHIKGEDGQVGRLRVDRAHLPVRAWRPKWRRYRRPDVHARGNNDDRGGVPRLHGRALHRHPDVGNGLPTDHLDSSRLGRLRRVGVSKANSHTSSIARRQRRHAPADLMPTR